VVVGALTLSLLAFASSPIASAVGPEEDIRIAAPGPLGAISVIGDSVLVGAAIEPSLPANLAAAGWGPIRFRAGLGYTAGNFQPSGSKFSAANWIAWWRAEGWDAPNVVVNLGNNDVGFCKASLECNADTIRYMLDAIGPGKTVWWSKITRIYTLQAEANAYNGALDLVASERSNLKLWDWPAVRDATGIAVGWDGIHLRDSVAYRSRSALMAIDITAQLARAEHSGVDAHLPTVVGTASEYEPLAPVRVLDTREIANGRLGAGEQAVIDLSDLVPSGTTAVAVNLTSVDPDDAGFLTGHPCGATIPLVSSANYTAGTARGALAVLPLSSTGRLCVFTSAAADLVVDLQGAFVPDASRLSVSDPIRLADTRLDGRSTPLVLDIPLESAPDATGVVLNITSTESTSAGFVTAYPCGGAIPVVSNLNFGPGETVAGAAYVPLGAGGDVCLFSNVQADVDLVVDLTGIFSPTGDLRFSPAAPTRTYDTRDGTGGWSPVHGGGQTTDVRVAPPSAVAVTGTLTMVTPSRDGFVTAFGCGAVPPTSNVNAPRGGVLANSVTVVLAAEGRLCLRASAATQVVFDTTGWWAP
jgi:hypothetical protein